MPELIRVLLVDDDASVRRGLRMRLGLAPDIIVVGEAADGRTGVQQAALLQPAVVVLDLHMPGMGGLEACPLLRTPATAVVMLSIDDDETMRARCAEAGASAFVSKHSPAATLLAAIRSAAASRWPA